MDVRPNPEPKDLVAGSGVAGRRPDEEVDKRSVTMTGSERTRIRGGNGGDLVRILMVAEDFPWPSLGGGLIRLAKMAEAVSAVGEMDLFSLYDPRRTSPALPASLEVRRMEAVQYPDTLNPHWWRSWMLRRGTPKEVYMRRYDRSPRVHFEAFASNHYDVVWFSTAATFEWMGRPRLGPTIVDLMDLEDVKARQMSSLLRVERPGGGPRQAVLVKGRAAVNRVNAHDWKVFQRSVAAEVDHVILCSDDDVRRSGLANAVAVPNTYGRPGTQPGKRRGRQAAHHSVPGEPALSARTSTVSSGSSMK